ncbi:MAG: RiPP maturation radical SAM C-methyltransferase [Chloroflexi bacterium]|nr:RiPP maturation radical SAM C-methyltransferase [Chloroflexota bacterium]
MRPGRTSDDTPYLRDDGVRQPGAEQAKRSVCLISMPFTPILMPGLGVSTLKSTLHAAGITAGVYYGALDFFRFFTPDHDPRQALFDYNFLASNGDLGDVFFSSVLWRDSISPIRDAFEEIRISPNALYTRSEVELLLARLLTYVKRAEGFIDHCLRVRDWGRYDIVGFSSTFCQNAGSLALARVLRERYPDLHIVFGGANCEGEMGVQLLRSFPWVDTVIQGEADFTFPEFVRRWRNGEGIRDVPGVVYRDGGEVRTGPPPQPVQRMDTVPFPDFTDYFEQLPELILDQDVRDQLSLAIETSRGCWWGAVSHCTFCGLNPTMMTFRSKSPDRAIAEFRYMKSRYDQRRICAVDNIIGMQYFKDVLPKLEPEGLEIFYETKANLKEEQVQQLARSGVTAIQPGIEGLSSEVLRLMKKGVKGYQNIELLKWCSTYGVSPIWFYLYRFPHEPHEPYWRDIHRFERLAHLPPPKNPNPVVIDRYSPLFQFRDAFELKNLRPAKRARVCYRGLTEEELARISYHFDADLPQGNDLPYEVPLWTGILRWNYEYARGARFSQFEAAHSTLLVDTRQEKRRCFLLSGMAHRLHRLLRRAHPLERIVQEFHCVRVEPAEPELPDLLLACAAGELGAEEIGGPADAAEVDRFLAELEQRWIVMTLDDRWIALAVDCTSVEEATPYGLASFVRVLAGAPPLDRPGPQLPAAVTAFSSGSLALGS